jgi:flagellar protein FliO/FliZ
MKSLLLTRGAVLTAAFTLAPAAGAFAAAGGENTPLHLSGTSTVHAAASSGSSGIVRTIVGLFIVIAVIYGVAWLLRQVKGAKNRPTGHGLDQVATLPLGGGKSIALVRAGSEFVLLGVAEHGITPIRTYTEEEALTLGLEVSDDAEFGYEPAEPAGTRVTDLLRRLTVRS